MINVLIAIGICIMSYLLGCFSFSRIIAKFFKKLNVYEVGTGFAITENIYHNISKPLGVLSASVDAVKIYLFIHLVKWKFSYFGLMDLSFNTMLFIFGFFMLLGHCLPATHKFRGGRGIFIFTGMLLSFNEILLPMSITLVIAGILFFVFKQSRFSQFLIVLFPPLLSIIIYDLDHPFIRLMVISAMVMGIINFIVSKRLKEL